MQENALLESIRSAVAATLSADEFLDLLLDTELLQARTALLQVFGDQMATRLVALGVEEDEDLSEYL